MDQVRSIGTNDFRIFLEQELGRRHSANPNYSLRAFARDLGVDSSFLSKLLNGKRAITARTITYLAPRLELGEEKIQVYLQKASARRRPSFNTFGNLELTEVENQNLVQLMEWYHIAILELARVKAFKAEAAWIAERLAITEEQARQALNDLTTNGALSQLESGQWKSQISNHTVSSKKFPRVKLVKKQIYEQALQKLPENHGNHSTVTLAISENRYEEAVERITRFRRELTHFLQEPEPKEKVYQLLISLFPVSR